MAQSNVTALKASQEMSGDRQKDRNTEWRQCRRWPYDFLEQNKPLNNQQSSCLINLPPNIRHKYGSRVCDTLFSDKDLLNISLDRHKAMSLLRRSSKKESIKSLQVDLDSNYAFLGQTIRYNIFPGLTVDHTVSQTHTDFNNQVHQRRVQNPDTFHHHRDNLTTWSEQNVMYERLKKAWEDEYPLDGKKQ